MLAFTLAFRELRGGIRDFRWFLSCLIIGVTVIAAVGALSGLVEKGFKEQAKMLLGGDAEISLTNIPMAADELAFIKTYGRVSLTVSLRAMAIHDEDSALVEVKGVDDTYPLLGETELVSHKPLLPTLEDRKIVIEQSLVDRFSLKQGETISIGDAHFTIAGILQREPDRIASAFSLGPHVIAKLSDLEKTGLLLPGSLIRYNYHLLLSDPRTLNDFKEALAKNFPHAPWTVKTFNENNRTVQSLVERLQLFLTLAGLSSLLIGGVGILNATESYLSKKKETIATMKTLGASRNLVFKTYLLTLFIIAVLGTTLSALLGVWLAGFLLPYLAQFFPISNDTSFDFHAVLLAITFGMLTVFTFSVAVLGRGVEVKPALLFRGSEAINSKIPLPKQIANIVLLGSLIATILLSASDVKIAIGFIGSALLCFIIFAAASESIQFIAKKIHVPKPWIRMAIANLHRPGANTFSIMLSIGIGLTVLIALLQVEGNFQQDISETIPSIAPSLFIIDIQPYEKDSLIKLLRAKPYVSKLAYSPMVRGRITKLKGIAVDKAPISSDAKWATESDRGFSYADDKPADAVITQGTWWDKEYHGKNYVSLDRKLAEGMGLTIGDTITLNILGQEITAEIANMREINYASFQINFAIILSTAALAKFPATTLATLHIDGADNEALLNRELSKRFPNISVIRIKDSLLQLQEIVSHIATALRITAIMVLISGLVVLASALTATLEKRSYDTVVLKVLGARRLDILKTFLMEWLILASITGLLACGLGSAGAWLILKRLDFFAFHIILPALAKTLSLTIIFITSIGCLIHFYVFGIKAGTILRNE